MPSPVLLLILYLCLGTGSPCMLDWEPFGDSCYAFGETAFDWPEAQDFCHSAGARLAEIESSAENDFLKAQALQKRGANYWIGGTDVIHEGNWIWISTGELMSFTDWHPGQPDDHLAHDDCLILWGNGNYEWGDADCTTNQFFICEAPAEESIVG